MIVVSDAGPLITLLDGGQIAALHELFDTVLIPERVYKEVFLSGRQRAKPTWIRIEALSDAESLALYTRLIQPLDPGEAEAIALALYHKCAVLIDDQAGRGQCELLRCEYVSLYNCLKRGLAPNRFAAVLSSVREASGVMVVEPDF